MYYLSIFIAVVSFALSASAQITITEGSLAGIGTKLFVHEQTIVNSLNVGSGGANQNWNVADLDFGRIRVIEVLDPSETQWSASFPNATHCVKDSFAFGEDYYFDRLEPSRYVRMGTVSAFDPTNVWFNDPEQLIWPLPLSYESPTWTAVTQSIFTIGDDTWWSRDSVICDPDGWGTLVTGYGSHNVLRVFCHSWHTSRLNNDPPSTIHVISYSWVDVFGNEIAKMSALAADTTFSNGVATVIEVETIVNYTEHPQLSMSFSLHPNYPNPFNPTTTIAFDLAERGFVTLNVFNVAGQLVATPVEGIIPAGSHRVMFDAATLASGVFFARLNARGESLTRKMILMR